MRIGALTWNPGQTLLLIAGPCVIESQQLCIDIAGRVKETCARLGIAYVFKASFDKANRSSIKNFRGQGMEAGLEVLQQVRRQIGVPVLTDVHESAQCPAVGRAVDILQIPAFLCRQTDLLVAAAQTGKPVNVKKGQFMSPAEMAHAAEKVRQAGNPDVLLTERGTFFGYNRLVNDFTAIPQMKAFGGGTPVIMDATHSTQFPGGLNGASGGQRQYVPLLARCGIVAGVDGLFIETHPEPEQAASDAATMLALADLPRVLEECVALRGALAGSRR
jgi:2-dehydro-3-deoxyphosphooctonate aldolase (KDO 8-P synthase)